MDSAPAQVNGNGIDAYTLLSRRPQGGRCDSVHKLAEELKVWLQVAVAVVAVKLLHEDIDVLNGNDSSITADKNHLRGLRRGQIGPRGQDP